MNDWAVFWVMLALVLVLWAVAARVHEQRRASDLRRWNEMFGRDRWGGPPRVVP